MTTTLRASVLVFLAVGCGDNLGGQPPDADLDAVPDAAVDAPIDAAVDAPIDAAPDAAPDAAMCDATTCSGHGACSDASGTPTCTCDDRYAGATCAACIAGWGDAGCTTCVRYVDAAASGAGTGLTWADAFTTLQPAIDSARTAITDSAGAITTCEVWVAQGTYHVYASSDADTITLRTNVPVYGGFSGTGVEILRADRDVSANVTILDGRDVTGAFDVDHVVSAIGVSGSNVITTLDGVTITHGDASAGEPAGGVYALYAGLTVNHCVFVDNQGGDGGGLYAQFAGVTIRDTAFTHNTSAANGGALYFNTGSLRLIRTSFTENTSTGLGGAVFDHAGTLSVENTQFVRNRATGDGGALRVEWLPTSSTSTIKTSTFERNATPAAGGAVSVFQGNVAALTVENALAYGNLAADGGGISADVKGSLAVRSSTLFGNRATGTRGGGAITSSGVAAVVTNSVLFGNHPFGNDEVGPRGTALEVTYSIVDAPSVPSGAGNSNANPGFERAPMFYDLTAATGAADSIVVDDGARYLVGDVLELAGFGVAETVTAVNGNTVTFDPPWLFEIPAGASIANWGAGVDNTSADFTPADGSACIDAANGDAAPSTDLLGNARRDVAAVPNTGTGTPAYVDLGALERQAL